MASRRRRRRPDCNPKKAAARPTLVGELGFIQARNEAESIFVIDVFENVIGKFKSVHLPHTVIFAVVVEILVGGFESTEVGSVFHFAPGVFAKEDAVLVFGKELAGEARLTAEFFNDGSYLGIDVRETI
jgi:hypothetical protein